MKNIPAVNGPVSLPSPSQSGALHLLCTQALCTVPMHVRTHVRIVQCHAQPITGAHHLCTREPRDSQPRGPTIHQRPPRVPSAGFYHVEGGPTPTGTPTKAWAVNSYVHKHPCRSSQPPVASLGDPLMVHTSTAGGFWRQPKRPPIHRVMNSALVFIDEGAHSQVKWPMEMHMVHRVGIRGPHSFTVMSPARGTGGHHLVHRYSLSTPRSNRKGLVSSSKRVHVVVHSRDYSA